MSTNVHPIEGDDKPNTESLLLKLPGEIRNHIYDYAVEGDGPIILRHHDPTIYLQRKYISRWDLSPSYHCKECEHGESLRPFNWRAYYGLTQVCRQIRSEFLPLHRTRTRVHIYQTEFRKYLDMLLELSGGQVRNVAGNVVLRATDCARLRLPPLDLLPLIDMEKHAPRLSLSSILQKCTHSSFSDDQSFFKGLMDPLLDSSRFPLLSRYAQMNLSSVMMLYTGHDHKLCLCLKEDHEVPARWKPGDADDDVEEKLRTWMESVGLSTERKNERKTWESLNHFVPEEETWDRESYWLRAQRRRPRG
ncbi:hypothetical protein NX059_012014 [Plenodomus lindquistii]|nr:hypothetical protein NX059_012014 [Plenodomus lindquistii]